MKIDGTYFAHSNLLFNLERIRKFYNSLIDVKTITIMDLEAFYWEDNTIVQKNFKMRLPFYIGAITLIWEGNNFKINNYRKFYFYNDINQDNLLSKQTDTANIFIKYVNNMGTNALLFFGRFTWIKLC
ncbi:hypothetical protein [Spiroplasma endosymbiont of Labia minor]|uniref:hypothetical protein n=1 Tax=Spiroplasma endosymbiont of Labia minor TaxID=3066305 RepID=UPI0030D109AD